MGVFCFVFFTLRTRANGFAEMGGSEYGLLGKEQGKRHRSKKEQGRLKQVSYICIFLSEMQWWWFVPRQTSGA